MLSALFPTCAWILYAMILASSIKPGLNDKVTGQDVVEGETRLRHDKEIQLFQDKKHPSYRVIHPKLYISRSKRSVEESKTMSLELPIGNESVNIELHQVDITHPDMIVRVNDQVQKTIIQRDCYFCGCENGTCAVVSTCDGLTGIIEQSSGVYQLEEVSESDIEALPDRQRTRRDASERTIVMWKLDVNLKEGNKYIPLPEAPTFSDFNDYAKKELYEENVKHKEFEIVEEDSLHGPRVRRRIDGPYTVELAVFVDHHHSRYIAKRYPGANVVEKIQDIVLTLINAVHRMYDTAALGDSRLGIMLKEIDIETEDDKKHKDHDGDIYEYLASFCHWQAARNPRGKSGEWDHALLLSGLDLWNIQKTQNSTVGLAYVGGMCSTSYSCTVNEGVSLAAAYIIAHEMGHNLGMRHDGDQGVASSCPKSKYLMSPVMSSGAATWSSCSKLALENFLSKKGSCLKSSRGITTKSADHHGLSPGVRYDADEQCHYMYGTGWNQFYNTEDPFNNVCKEIWCRKGRHLRTPTAPALEGTSCGHKKACQAAECKDENLINKIISSNGTKNNIGSDQIPSSESPRSEPTDCTVIWHVLDKLLLGIRSMVGLQSFC